MSFILATSGLVQFFYDHDSVKVAVVAAVVVPLVNIYKPLIEARMDSKKRFPHDIVIETLTLLACFAAVYLLQWATPGGLGTRLDVVTLGGETVVAFLTATGLYVKTSGGVPVTPAISDPRVAAFVGMLLTALTMGGSSAAPGAPPSGLPKGATVSPIVPSEPAPTEPPA